MDLYDRLRVPTSDNIEDFIMQVSILQKCLIESINITEIKNFFSARINNINWFKKVIISAKDKLFCKKIKQISYLEKLLKQLDINDDGFIDFLKDLQRPRSISQEK